MKPRLGYIHILFPHSTQGFSISSIYSSTSHHASIILFLKSLYPRAYPELLIYSHKCGRNPKTPSELASSFIQPDTYLTSKICKYEHPVGTQLLRDCLASDWETLFCTPNATRMSLLYVNTLATSSIHPFTLYSHPQRYSAASHSLFSPYSMSVT